MSYLAGIWNWSTEFRFYDELPLRIVFEKGVWLKDVGRCVRYIWDISWHGCRLSFLLAVESLDFNLQRQLPEMQCRFKFIAVWMHYLSHTDLPDFRLIDAWACSWVTIALEKTDICMQSKCDKQIQLKKTALIDELTT